MKLKLTPLFVIALLSSSALCAEPIASWQQTGSLAAAEAHQAAAADDDSYFAINNTSVARYDRATGQRTAVSSGEAKHLNSGFLYKGKLYCAHSNFPRLP